MYTWISVAMEPFKSLPGIGRTSKYDPAAIAALAVKQKPKATANNSRARADIAKVVYRPSDNDRHMKPLPKHQQQHMTFPNIFPASHKKPGLKRKN